MMKRGATVYPLGFDRSGRAADMFFACWAEEAAKNLDKAPLPKLTVSVQQGDGESFGETVDDILGAATGWAVQLDLVDTPLALHTAERDLGHGLRFRAWLRRYNGGRVECTVAIHAGECHELRNGFQSPGHLRFRRITVELDCGGERKATWESGDAGETHLFPMRAILPIRLELDGETAEVYWQDARIYPTFGPAKALLPSRATDEPTSEYGATSPRHGPWHLIGESSGAVGGADIYLAGGFARGDEARGKTLYCVDRWVSRQRKALTHNGHTIWPGDWEVAQQYDLSSGEHGDTSELAYWRNRSAFQGGAAPAPYEAALLSFRPEDGAHARWWHHLVDGWWLYGDELSKWALEQYAADMSHGEWCERGAPPLDPDTVPPGTWIPKSQPEKMTRAGKPTGKQRGGWYGRELGWVLSTLSAAHATMNAEERKRTGIGRRVHALLALLKVATPACGIPQVHHWGQHRPGEWPADGVGAQSFEFGILVNGVTCALQSVITSPELREEIVRIFEVGAENLYVLSDVMPYGGSAVGPRHFVVTFSNGVAVSPPFRGTEDGDPAHVWHAFACLHRLRAKRVTISDSLRQWVPHETLRARLAFCQSATDPLVRAWSSMMEAELELMLTRRFG